MPRAGGNRWDSTFLDTFRYLDQLGRLARAGVQVVMHNTLAASDYGLLDETTFRPRPSYLGRAALASADGNDGARRGRGGSARSPICAHAIHRRPAP